MNKIRLNNEKEEILIKGVFGINKFYKLFMIFFSIIISLFTIFLVVLYVLTGFAEFLGVSAIILLLEILMWLPIKKVKQSEFFVTNKVVKGKTVGVFVKKLYSYRLDEIENIDTTSVLGMHSLILNFSQGKVVDKAVSNARLSDQGKTFGITNLINLQEVYEGLTALLTKVKNEKDVAIDIEIKRIETEEKKTEMMSKLAEGFTNKTIDINKQDDDISKIERLYKLREQGIITQEEFDKKKKELLNLNET